MRVLACFLLVMVHIQAVLADTPACNHPDDWAASMAFSHLKNAGLVQSETNDFSKTRVFRLTSEKIGKDLYRQIHRIVFSDKLGNTIEVITVSDASRAECSMGGGEVFVVSRELGGLGD